MCRKKNEALKRQAEIQRKREEEAIRKQEEKEKALLSQTKFTKEEPAAPKAPTPWRPSRFPFSLIVVINKIWFHSTSVS